MTAASVPLDSAGVAAGVLFAQPTTGGGTTSAEQLLTFAILGARSRLYITNSYFVPNADFRRMLTDAAERGVDVRVLTVGPLTDVKTPWLAGRSYYESLRAHGVRVYEYQPAMMHAKTIVVDGRWSTIGSMNFDNHSLALNDESNLVVFDSAFGSQDGVGVLRRSSFREGDDARRACRPLDLGARLGSRRGDVVANSLVASADLASRRRLADEREHAARNQHEPRGVDEADQEPLRPCVSVPCNHECQHGRQGKGTDKRGTPRALPRPLALRRAMRGPRCAEAEEGARRGEHQQLLHAKPPWFARHEPYARDRGERDHGANCVS